MEITRTFFLIVILVLLMHGTKTLGDDGVLLLDYYKETCPLAEEIVRRNVENAVLKDPLVAASLLRLHFHDCFVTGCDGSVLLDSSEGMVSEKHAGPNINSLRGFEVIDRIKYNLEEACPCTVSCADILTLAARDSVALRGGPNWRVFLGRRDSLKASLDDANQYLPSPNSSLETLITKFKLQGLDSGDLVTLSGSHTMGRARCVSFRKRIYDISMEERYDKYKRYTTFRKILQSICPKSGRDNQFTPLDHTTPARFDNHYYVNLLEGRGLLFSDNSLVAQDHEGEIIKQVWAFAADQDLFFASFVNSIIKMGNINVLTGQEGEIRKNCRFINT
ncbi:peroxidase 20 isoform X1 [Mangifera indica]|uniref:peroxidase 20 isoform X1 n=1 Tax=Mangifera indica TaxID=29780 RepID=UPI001CFAA2B1|nr:peroxidase 20 isoform X1 [Mangifera indica]XP_044503260.1 peroxidase 20 isoform X1 [Mangifera indica]